jgi:hypothetical protein
MEMSLDLHSQIHELQERLARLERAPSKPRGRTNQIGAARYLNMSEETLRQRHARGEGPRRSKNGRYWSYTFEDLDAYAEQDAA